MPIAAIRPIGVAVLAGLMMLGGCAATPDEGGHLANGKRLAERDCGGCHAIEAGKMSPSPDAVPFPRLHMRYDVDQLAGSLGTGMMVGHPRMPLVVLGEDEIADLTAYVKSVQAEH